jgi:hypothetical protein
MFPALPRRAFVAEREISPETLGAVDGTLSESAWLVGVVVPGDGAYFDLMDRVGTAAVDFLRFDDQQARDRILSNIHVATH